MDNTLELKSPTASNTTQLARVEEVANNRNIRPSEATVAEERPDDQRVGKLEQLQRVADEAFQDSAFKLSISYNEASGRFVYKGVDRETGEVVREFPAEEMLDRIAKLRTMTGVSIDREL